MEQKIKKLADVFTTVGLPPYTYVKPAHYGEVRADIEQPGKHLLIEGPSGIGKSCVIFKVLEELRLQQGVDYSYLTCRDEGTSDAIDSYLASARGGSPTPLLVIDDFHLLSPDKRREVGSELKRLSDMTFIKRAPPKVALIGIPTTGVSLLSEAFDLGPRLGIYRPERATDHEIEKLLDYGEEALNVIFEDRPILLNEAAGNFWLAQYICNKICATQAIFETSLDTSILSFDLLSIRRRLMQELASRYMPTARTFAKGKKWRPGGNKPYLEILIALAKIPDSVITFDKILNVVAERRRPGIKAVRPRINEVLLDPSRGIDLRKNLAFDSESGFTIEDPLFRYFLSNLDTADLYRELGIESGALESSKTYSFDVGFSFAGETRALVEEVNALLKAEDVVTFYDFDQQALLLGTNLETYLGAVYDASCRYYLVFLDAAYRKKAWTLFERDTMVASGRSNHIIPVVLDSEGTAGTVGIPNVLGRIDLQDVWARIRDQNGLGDEERNAIRNRCVLPLVEKLSSPDGH